MCFLDDPAGRLRWICVFLILSSILVFAPSIPSASSTRGAVTMVNVHFFNLPNITIGNVQGVERISFDTWRACYYGAGAGDGICVNATTVIGGQYKPYSITIYNRDNGQQVTASAAWSIILVAQLFGCLMIVIGAVILVLYTRWYWRTPSDCDFQYQYEINNPLPDPKAKPPPPRRWKCGHYRRAITLWILFSVWLSMAIILAMDLGTYMSIKNGMLSLGSAGTMLSLGSAGTQRIETTLGPGLILNILICLLLILALGVKCFDKGYNWKAHINFPKPAPDMPSQWHCSPLLTQYGEDCHKMECYHWCS